MGRAVRVALLTPILAPYRVPAFRALASTPDWDLRVFVNAESEFDRSWNVDAQDLDVEFLPTLSIPRRDRTLHLAAPWSLGRALDRFRMWSSALNWEAAASERSSTADGGGFPSSCGRCPRGHTSTAPMRCAGPWAPFS